MDAFGHQLDRLQGASADDDIDPGGGERSETFDLGFALGQSQVDSVRTPNQSSLLLDDHGKERFQRSIRTEIQHPISAFGQDEGHGERREHVRITFDRSPDRRDLGVWRMEQPAKAREAIDARVDGPVLDRDSKLVDFAKPSHDFQGLSDGSFTDLGDAETVDESLLDQAYDVARCVPSKEFGEVIRRHEATGVRSEIRQSEHVWT